MHTINFLSHLLGLGLWDEWSLYPTCHRASKYTPCKIEMDERMPGINTLEAGERIYTLPHRFSHTCSSSPVCPATLWTSEVTKGKCICVPAALSRAVWIAANTQSQICRLTHSRSGTPRPFLHLWKAASFERLDSPLFEALYKSFLRIPFSQRFTFWPWEGCRYSCRQDGLPTPSVSWTVLIRASWGPRQKSLLRITVCSFVTRRAREAGSGLRALVATAGLLFICFGNCFIPGDSKGNRVPLWFIVLWVL